MPKLPKWVTNDSELPIAANKRELRDMLEFDNAAQAAMQGNPATLAKSINRAGTMALGLKSTFGLKHMVDRIINMSKDKEKRREIAVYVIDSIMRHASHNGDITLESRFQRHIEIHLPNIFKRALRSQATRRPLAEKFLTRYITDWSRKNWFSEKLVDAERVLIEAVPSLRSLSSLDKVSGVPGFGIGDFSAANFDDNVGRVDDRGSELHRIISKVEATVAQPAWIGERNSPGTSGFAPFAGTGYMKHDGFSQVKGSQGASQGVAVTPDYGVASLNIPPTPPSGFVGYTQEMTQHSDASLQKESFTPLPLPLSAKAPPLRPPSGYAVPYTPVIPLNAQLVTPARSQPQPSERIGTATPLLPLFQVGTFVPSIFQRPATTTSAMPSGVQPFRPGGMVLSATPTLVPDSSHFVLGTSGAETPMVPSVPPPGRLGDETPLVPEAAAPSVPTKTTESLHSEVPTEPTMSLPSVGGEVTPFAIKRFGQSSASADAKRQKRDGYEPQVWMDEATPMVAPHPKYGAPKQWPTEPTLEDGGTPMVGMWGGGMTPQFAHATPRIPTGLHDQTPLVGTADDATPLVTTFMGEATPLLPFR